MTTVTILTAVAWRAGSLNVPRCDRMRTTEANNERLGTMVVDLPLRSRHTLVQLWYVPVGARVPLVVA